eukprot:gene1637-1978_t
MRAPLGGSRGWEISSTLTIPLLNEHMADAVELGEVLGAGNTFRCFRGRWAGQAVAVKVFDHDADATPAVEAELQQVMSLSHPNLVQCFHAITYTHAISHPTAASTQSPPSMPDTHNVGLDTLELPQRTVSILSISMPDRSSISGSMSGPFARTASADSSQAVSSYVLPSARTSLSSAGPSGAWAGTAVVGSRCSGAAAAAETWVVQELCDLGSAASIAASWRLQPESVRQMVLRLRLLQDAAQGLKELHRLNLIHGDLNAHNVLICTSSKAPSGMQGKLVDYSLSRLAKQLAARQAASVKSLSHQPPEVLKLGRATAAADIYAFGVM